jgi:hypothetical protein
MTDLLEVNTLLCLNINSVKYLHCRAELFNSKQEERLNLYVQLSTRATAAAQLLRHLHTVLILTSITGKEACAQEQARCRGLGVYPFVGANCRRPHHGVRYNMAACIRCSALHIGCSALHVFDVVRCIIGS